MAELASQFATTRGLGTTASLPQAGVQHRDDDCAALDDKQRCVSAPAGRLLAVVGVA